MDRRRRGGFDGRMDRRFSRHRLYRGLDRSRFGMRRGRYHGRASAGLFGSFSVVISVLFFPTRGMDVALNVRADQSFPE
jgi:hypothetical protein